MTAVTQITQNEGELFCNPPICQAASRRQSLQTPQGTGKQGESTHHNQSPWGIATAYNPSFWAGTVGAHLKCCCMPVVPERSRGNQARSICKLFECYVKCGLVFVLFCLFFTFCYLTMLPYYCYSFVLETINVCLHILMNWEVLLECKCQIHPLLCCVIHMSCNSLQFSPQMKISWDGG